MPIFIILGNFTAEGIKGIKTLKKRQEEAKKLVESFGGKLLGLYYTMGRYDWVSIVDGPSIETATKALYIFGSNGANRTETLVAITADAAAKIAGEIP